MNLMGQRATRWRNPLRSAAFRCVFSIPRGCDHPRIRSSAKGCSEQNALLPKPISLCLWSTGVQQSLRNSTGTESEGSELIVLNKSDLPEHADWKESRAARISCLTGAGISELEEQMIGALTKGSLQPENSLAINARHHDCLRRALVSCQSASAAIAQGLTPDCYAIDLEQALAAVGEIIGSVDHENILDSVFSQFCIGK